MNRRDLFRRAAALPALSVLPAALPAAQAPADWKPVFLDAHQNDTLVAFADLLIPATETPGAKASDANRFIDLLLSAVTAEKQKAFLNALAYLDGECRQRYGAAFAHLSRERQTDFMHLIAYPRVISPFAGPSLIPADDPGHGHFRLLKEWVARAFYNSEVGMRSLGWDGSAPHGDFGCKPK
jgi:gluconate 2-dehydrogenase gamma chain